MRLPTIFTSMKVTSKRIVNWTVNRSLPELFSHSNINKDTNRTSNTISPAVSRLHRLQLLTERGGRGLF